MNCRRWSIHIHLFCESNDIHILHSNALEFYKETMTLLNSSGMGMSAVTTVLITLFAGLIVNFLFRLYKHRQLMSGLVSLLIFVFVHDS